MHWGARRHGARVVRDPIHGDILLPPIAEAVVGSLEFQRLRYIRQNGLLHFVFPGAVHTRFAHSLGTMANAQAVWYRLTTDLAEQEKSEAFSRAREYLGEVFELAALLHDVGHCAFSHASEQVEVKGAPLFGTVRELFTQWGGAPVLEALIKHDPKLADRRAKHEEIGLLLVTEIFRSEDRLNEQCKKFLDVEAGTIGLDIVGLLHECKPVGGTRFDRCPAFDPSPQFLEHSKVLIEALERRWGMKISADNATPMLRHILHDLISGTLDVDRMDYLLRDASFCGVTYGKYDREILVGSLEIVPDEDGRLYLTLDTKAAFALDDLLWSRYQMFIQIYNHKTNVVMGHMLGRALSWAIDQGHLTRPRLREQYVAFTDDLVMGTVFSKCSDAEGARKTPFGRTLTRRSIPKYVGSALLTEPEEPARKREVEQKREALLAELRGPKFAWWRMLEGDDDVLAIPASSDLIKGETPYLRFWEKGTDRPKLEAFANRSSILQSKNFSASHHMVHFFKKPTE